MKDLKQSKKKKSSHHISSAVNHISCLQSHLSLNDVKTWIYLYVLEIHPQNRILKKLLQTGLARVHVEMCVGVCA